MGYLLRYQSEFTELAKSRFLDCDSCGMTQGALIRNVADCQALYMQTKQPRSDILYMTTLDTGRCSHMYMCVPACIYTYIHRCIFVHPHIYLGLKGISQLWGLHISHKATWSLRATMLCVLLLSRPFLICPVLRRLKQLNELRQNKIPPAKRVVS